MSISYVLPRAVSPLVDETLASLVTRNARPYGFENPSNVLERLGQGNRPLGELAFMPPDPAIAALLSIEPSTLGDLSSWHEVGSMARVAGREIRRRFVHVHLRRSCPACLEESLHHRAFWDVIAISSCPRHGCRLVDRCPGCGKAPRWRGSRLERCGHDCSFDLRRDGRAEDGPVPAHVTGLGKLYADGPGARLAGLELDFGRAVEVAFVIGSHARRSGLFGRSSSYLRNHPESAIDTMETGWNVLAGWPDSFHGMLDDLRGKAAERKARFGLYREFGAFATWLSKHATEPWAAPLRDRFADYLGRQPDLRTTAAALRRYGSSDQLRNRHMTMRDAALFLKVSPETIAELAERENLFLVRPSGHGAPSLLRADLVHGLRARKDATLSRQDAAAMLGVGPDTLRRMLATGLLTPVPSEDRVTQFRLLVRVEVEDLLRRVHGNIEEAVPRGKLVPLAFAMAGRRDTLDVLQAVLDGRLRARGVRSGKPGLRGLLFDSREVEEIVSPDIGTLTLVAAAARLSMDVESIRDWAREDWLATVRTDSRHERGDRVTEEGLRTFAATFITSIEVGRLASLPGRWAGPRLAFLGVPPVPSASVTKLFRRADVTPDIVRRLHPRASAGRANSVAESNELVDRVGQDVGLRLGRKLRRAWSGFSDGSDETYVQVIVGRRQRCCSNYIFRFNPQMRKRLAVARDGWLALALAGFDTYILVPWAQAGSMVGSATDHRHHIRIAVDAHGRVVDDPALEGMQRWIGEG